MYFYKSIVSVLSLFSLLAPTAMGTLPFGHYGAEGTVLFLNGFHFVSGHSDWEISANHCPPPPSPHVSCQLPLAPWTEEMCD